jgi:hypothetical protein
MVMQSKTAIRTSNIATISLSARSNRSSDIALTQEPLHLSSGEVKLAKFGLHVGNIKYTDRKINKYMLSSSYVQLYQCIVPNIMRKKDMLVITDKNLLKMY